MKKTLLTRLYALALSAVLACVATAGVAVMMASGAEQAQQEFAASAAANARSAGATAPALTQLKTPAATSSARVL